MSEWMRFPSGQYNLTKDEHPKRVAWVRKSPQGWDWIIQDITGRQIDRGTCRTASRARARAAAVIACEGMLPHQLNAVRKEGLAAGLCEEELP